MAGLLSRRAPWPYHMRLVHPTAGSVGLMLEPNPQTGLLVEKKAVAGDQVAPNVYDYGSYSPFVEKPYVFGRLMGGLGEATQRTATPARYKIARRADCSIGGRAILGPYVAQDGAAAVPGSGVVRVVRGFLTAPIPIQDAWLAFLDRGVWRRTAPGSWVQLNDLGVTQVGSWTLYAPVGATSAQLYVAGDAGTLWNFDGITTWTTCTLPSGMDAHFVERNQSELWIASTTNIVRKTTGDPLTGAGAWGGPIYVGDASTSITGIVSLASQLFVFKTDGVYAINTDGTVNELRPAFRLMGARITNGGARGFFRDRLWFRFGDGYFYLTGGSTATITSVGPERLLEATGLTGVPVAFCGHDPWFGYLAIYDLASNTSRLLKYGSWIPTDAVGGDLPGWSFAEVWHGPIAEWPGKTVSSLAVQPPLLTGSFPQTNPYLWVGFTDGTVQFTPLPVASPDPANDPGCVFVTGGVGEESYVDWPDHTAMAQADVKHFRTFVGEGPRLDSQNYVAVSYRTDPAAAFTALPSAFTRSGLRVSTPATGVTGVRLGVRESLYGTRTSTPQVSSVTLLEQVRPAMIETLSATARAARHLPKRDGTADRRTGEQIRAALRDLADGASVAGAGPVTALLPDETSVAVDVVDYAARESTDGYGLAWDVDLTLVTFQSNTVFGTWDRAAGMNWDQAAAYSWDEALSW